MLRYVCRTQENLVNKSYRFYEVKIRMQKYNEDPYNI